MKRDADGHTDGGLEASSTGTALGGFFVGVGVLTAAVALDLVPPFRK
ncbi:hypothetical protein ACYJ1Y_03630 [Natrialbaceae archaeon A-gly3]